MKTIIDIIQAGGGLNRFDRLILGKAIKIEPPGSGYMPLTIECVGLGPRGGRMIAVSHHYVQNGDVMVDPEMLFEVWRESWDKPDQWAPCEFRMDNPPVHRRAAWKDEYEGKNYVNANELKDEKSFMRVWNKNLREQGFIKKWKEMLGRPGADQDPMTALPPETIPIATSPMLDDMPEWIDPDTLPNFDVMPAPPKKGRRKK